MLKKNRGYSLIEIGVGILILTVFLLFSIGLFSACYNNYRRIKARNLAVDRAVYHMEKMLQTDSDELAGFFERISSNSRVPNMTFQRYVVNNFSQFKSKYAKLMNEPESTVTAPALASEDLRIFMEAYKEDLINAYIKSEVTSDSTTEEQLITGNYGFLDEEGKVDVKQEVLVNEMLFDGDDSNDYVVSNNGALKLVKTVTRIPASEGKAYGNNILICKVEVYYTKEFKRSMSADNMEVITFESVKTY